MSRGFISAANSLALVSDEAIFGPRAQVKVRKTKRTEQPFVAAFRDLNEGDLVVHVEHGIARYGGLTRMSIRGVDGDFLLLHYDGADKLYLPVEKLRQVQKFTGADPTSVRLDKLGGTAWDTRKRKVKEQFAADGGRAARHLRRPQGPHRSRLPRPRRPLPAIRGRVSSTRPPTRTRQSGRKPDMQSERPMDRLASAATSASARPAGRAAGGLLKAVLDKKQVAVLVPTTVLCSQHYRTFRERLKDYPVNVEMLSRLRDPKETKEILAKLKSGAVDIVIGTHKLLGKEIVFKDLGLVVVDEEQRFGVTQKEKLKKLRAIRN